MGTMIKLTNEAKVTEALNKAQTRCKARTVSYADVVDMCRWVELRLGISKKALDGVKFTADYHAQAFPAAYGYAPESTIVSAEYKNGTWRVAFERGYCRRPNTAYRVTLTDEAKTAIISRMETFGI